MKKMKIISIGIFLQCFFVSVLFSMTSCDSETETNTGNTGTEIGTNSDLLTIFTDLSCSELKKGVNDKEINGMTESFYKEIAKQLKAGNYEGKEFRIQAYRPYQNPQMAKKRTRTLHTWSMQDNVTGIFAEDDSEEVKILVGNTHGQKVELYTQDVAKGHGGSKLQLKEGLNVVKPGRGLFYILLPTEDYVKLNPTTEEEKKAIENSRVNIHFVTGQVNGYFDNQRHTAADNKRLREAIKFPYFDLKGKYSQIVWTSQDFVDAETDFGESLKWTDEIVRLELEHAGLIKYKKEHSNRMVLTISSSGGGNPNATAYRSIYPSSYKTAFATPSKESYLKRIWGIAHEIGHCSQLNPGMRWGGMGEVGNNMYSIYVKTQIAGLAQSNLLLENYYQRAREEIIVGKIAHVDGKQLMSKLVPFWQIHLYLTEAKGMKDFYIDLNEYFRTNEHGWTTFENSGPLQLDYVRQVCLQSKTNFIDFFQQWGLLTPVDKVINDYGNRILKITQADIDALIAEIEANNFAKPKKDVTLITDANIAEFK